MLTVCLYLNACMHNDDDSPEVSEQVGRCLAMQPGEDALKKILEMQMAQ